MAGVRTRSLRMLAPIVCVCVVAAPSTVFTQTATETPVLRVRGSAEIRVVPDLAVVRLGVANEAPTAQEAQQAVNETSEAILVSVRGLGIADQAIQTVRLVLSPVYSARRPGDDAEPRIVGYRASNTVSVRTEDLSLVAAVIDAALAAGANQLEGVSFGLQDDQTTKQRALRLAVDDARGKAEAMAAALGAELGSIVSITEDSGFVQEPMMEMSRVMALQSDLQTAVSPGEVTVSASVSIEYQLNN